MPLAKKSVSDVVKREKTALQNFQKIPTCAIVHYKLEVAHSRYS